MTERVRITDVAPRDGLQNEPGSAPTGQKVRLIESLAAAGVDEVEATSFVSPKAIPQLADAAEVITAVRERFGSKQGAARESPLSLGEGGKRRPVFSALVPNEKGFNRAVAFHSDDFPLKIAVFTAASETFNRRNINASVAESIERFRAFVPRAIEMDMDVRMYVSCAVACPYEGPIEAEHVRRVCDDLLALAPGEAVENGQVEVDLGDTIGVAAPDDIERLLMQFDEAERSRLVLHLHDTFGRAAACAQRALQMGVRSFDASAGGLGGCPFAGTKERPAAGNIATETLVRAVEEAGFETGVDRDRLAEASSLAREIRQVVRAEASER